MLAICAANELVSKETKDGSSKVPIGSHSGHFEIVSSSSLDTNPSQPPASTPVDVSMHKEDQQAVGGPTSLGVTSEEGAYPQLSSGMSALNLNKPIFLASFIIHYESASGHDASVDSTTEAEPNKSGTDPNVLADKTQSIEEANLRGDEFTISNETSKTIKLEDLSKLVQNVKDDFIDLDSPNDDPIIMVDESEEDEKDKDDEIHTTSNVESKDTLAPKHPSPSSLPTELKDLPSKFNDLTEEVKRLKKHVATVQAKLKTLDVLPSLLNKVTEALNQFSHAIALASKKTKDISVPSAGQAGTQPAKGEKNTNLATIS
ncbi:hypothetical protein Tco_0875694 [Tanacetum coccineum]|uniref:Uncharacterized protein n=1 Tax=Tanacetum coccineum TaxID=301880 RepID=A0ABQ5BR30_9ASTR